MENGFDTSLESRDGEDNTKGFGVSEDQGDEVFQEAIGTSQQQDLRKEEEEEEDEEGQGSVVGVEDTSKTVGESTLGVGFSSQSTDVNDDDDDGGDDNKFQEAVGGDVVNGVDFEDNVDSSVVDDDGVAAPAGYEGHGDNGQGRVDQDEEEDESSEVVDAFLDMVHSDLTTEIVETSGLDTAEITDSDSVVSKGILVPEVADSDSVVSKGIPVPEGADSDSVVSKGIPVPEGADSDSSVLKGIPVPEVADSESAVLKGIPVPEGVDSDSSVLKGIPVPEVADSDSSVLKGMPVPEGANSDSSVLKGIPVPEGADLDSAVVKTVPEGADSDSAVLKGITVPEGADSEHAGLNGKSIPEVADSDSVGLNGRPVPGSAENANSDCLVLNGRPVPEGPDSECVVSKGTPVPESADILLQAETNGEIMPQEIGKNDQPGGNEFGNAYREEETVDHTDNPHMEIQDDFDTEPTGKSACTDTKREATENGGEKGAETVLDTGHGDDNVAPKDLQHKGEPENITAVRDISEGKETDSPHNAAVAGSSSVKSTIAAASLPSRPAGLGRAAPLLEPAHRVAPQPRANGAVSPLQAQQAEEANGDGDEYDETREKLQMIRVKFLRLAHRLGQTPHNVVVAQVLYRLGLAEQLRGSSGGRVGAFSFDRASAMAEQLEAAGQEPLDFSCTILVLGKSGVGKSATINSLFDEPKFTTDAFQMGTRKVQDVVGTVQGIKVRVIDTPGLLPSWSDQHRNEKILQSVKRFIKKTPPDIVLYLDRLDMQSRDLGDMPLLRTITETFGPSIWFNAIVVLTHAASAPPDGPNGTASSYDMFVTQRSHVVQQAIRQAAGDMRLMNPVSLVENHSACRTNRAGQRVLPNGQVWKPHLLLLSFASKILGEANALLKLQDSPPGKPFVTQSRAPPLPFLLSSLLQSRPPLKLPEEQQYSDEDGLDDDLGDSSDSDNEMDYDDLPPFKSLSKAQLAKLNKEQRKAYFDELEYREKLLMKKQLKEESRRRKMMKKMAAAAKDLPSELNENGEEESSGAASVPVPMPDLALPASFDSDNPTHRYRYLDTSSPWLMRPVLDTNGWDHDVGYEGINVERLFVVKEKVPVSLSGQVTKDKKDSNMQMEVASSIKHGKGKATSLGFDMQSVGKDLAYTLRSETRFSNYKKNKASAGLSLTLLGDVLSAGVKLEDKLTLNRRFQMVVSGGAMGGRGDIAYGGSLEAQLRDKDYPLGRALSTLGLSVMDWHGDLAIGCNLQSQIPVGRSTNLIARANLNNRGSGQVSVRLNSSEQLQLVLLGMIPLLRKLLDVSQQQFGQ